MNSFRNIEKYYYSIIWAMAGLGILSATFSDKTVHLANAIVEDCPRALLFFFVPAFAIVAAVILIVWTKEDERYPVFYWLLSFQFVYGFTDGVVSLVEAIVRGQTISGSLFMIALSASLLPGLFFGHRVIASRKLDKPMSN